MPPTSRSPGPDRTDQNIAGVDTTRRHDDESPKAPHERDEAVGDTASTPDATVAQGAKDVEHGLTDTSRGEASDATYQKQR